LFSQEFFKFFKYIFPLQSPCLQHEGNFDSHYSWDFDNNNPYPHGNPKVSRNYGRTWYEINWTEYEFYDIDFCFASYGYNDPDAHADLSCQGNPIWTDVSSRYPTINSCWCRFKRQASSFNAPSFDSLIYESDGLF
jgi:hypothetical protein